MSRIKVTEVLDDNEFDVNCEFAVMYEGCEDTQTVKLVEEHNNKCVAIEGKADKPLSKNQNKLFS